MKMRRLTKTFAENRWFRRASPGLFTEIAKEETKEGLAIDEQVRQWVGETGHIIIHPGQLGMHTAWHGDAEDPFQLKCITFGLTVLYVESENVKGNAATTATAAAQRPAPIPHADPGHVDPGSAPTDAGTVPAGSWGNGGVAADGRRSTEAEGGEEERCPVSEEDAANSPADSPAKSDEASGSVGS